MTKKFRIWDHQLKLFWIGSIREIFGHLPTDISDNQIQQWTGLTDSQGVEIFEGDIVFSSLKSNVTLSRIFEVKFEQGAFNVGNPSKLYSLACDYTVKGNIFQNSELLENS
jgi:hypothetical protein